MDNINWSEYLEQAQNAKTQAELKRLDEQNELEQKHAAERETLRRMDAIVVSFLQAAQNQGYPGVEREFEPVTTRGLFLRQRIEQRFVAARYTSQHYSTLQNSVSSRPAAICVNINGNWQWEQTEDSGGNYDRALYLRCNNTWGRLSYSNETYRLALHPVQTPQFVMQVLAQIAVENAIIL